MRIDIIVVFVHRYARGHEFDFVPPLTGIQLAAVTPAGHDVRVVHQQVETVDLDTDADLVALSFYSGFAPEAYRLAREFRARGRRVVAGGPHVSYAVDESLEHFDALVVGEAEGVWAQVVADAERGQLERVYAGAPPSMADLPMPRYDLLSHRFLVPRVMQATRGCPFRCTFCTVPTLNPGFRKRPVEDVVRDIRESNFPWWWQRKVVWFWDDNLTIDRRYVRELLTALIPLKIWWITQASLDIAKDDELLALMEESGCIGICFGIETFETESLKELNKPQNKIAAYQAAIHKLHRRGICVMSCLMVGMDHDTPESIARMGEAVEQVGIDMPWLSIITPYRGTALYEQFREEGRLDPALSWESYNGYSVSYVPKRMTAVELRDAHRGLWRVIYGMAATARRIGRALTTLRAGAALFSITMNTFYGLKLLRGNVPVDPPTRPEYASVVPHHDQPVASPRVPRPDAAPPAAQRASTGHR